MSEAVSEVSGTASGAEPLLEVDGLVVTYGQAVAVADVSLAVRTGTVVALLGVNGAGKTTTLKAISGVHPAASGTIRFEGVDISSEAPRRIVRRGICHSPEGRRVFPRMSVRENLEMGGFTLSSREVTAGVERSLEIFPALASRQDQFAGTLSGGEQQMLAIARALMPRPTLLLLDEPTLGLSPKMVSTVAQIVRDVRESGVSILLVEQNANMALGVADEVYVIEGGRSTVHGTAAELRQRMDIQAAYFGR